MKIFYLIDVALAFGSILVANAGEPHKFDDGFVERTMAVVIRDKTGHVEYSIGLNESTVRDLLGTWESSSGEIAEPSNSTDTSVPSRSAGQPFNKKLEASLANAVGNPSNKSTDLSKTNPSGKPVDSAGSESKQRKKNVSAGKSTSTQPTASKNSADGHEIAPELMARFKKLAPVAIAKGLKITCDEKSIPIISIEEGPPSRHPFTMTIKFKFELPEFKICDLKINDENFADQSGAARYAFKTAGRSMLMQSDVAPILVRANRIELAQPSKRELRPGTSINVRLGMPAPRID